MHEPKFITLLITSAALDTIVACILLFRVPQRYFEESRRRHLGLSWVFYSAVATGVFVVIKLAFLFLIGLDIFAAMHLIFLDGAVVLPIIAIAFLISERIRRNGEPLRHLTRPLRFAAVLSLGIIPLVIYATIIEPQRLQLETAELVLPRGRSGNSDISIGILADIQTDRVSDYERHALDWMMEQRPDVIFLPGDLYQGTLEQFNAAFDDLRELLLKLDAPGGVYFVMGDSDHVDRVERLFAGTRVQLLLDRIVKVRVRDRAIIIGGIELSHWMKGAKRTVADLESISGQEDIRILLAHRPDVVMDLWHDSRIDLVVAGHTHGGQVVIPFFGPPVTFSSVPRLIAAGGLHTYDGHSIYVSRGVGHECGHAPRIRFLCPPEISLVTLKSPAK